MITLFGDATIDNWTDNMHAVADSAGQSALRHPQ
jgi:hypothetical protein